MTEITAKQDALPPAAERFVLQWGDMGGQWGVNRSVGQIHALLYLSDRPLTADDIADQLGMARSNVSNSLKELQTWRLIRRVSLLGDRRDYFEAEADLWEMLLRIVAGRKEREIDPAIATLRQCVQDAKSDTRLPPVASARLSDMLEFVEALNRWYEQVQQVPKSKLVAIVKMGGRIANLLGARKRTPQGRK
jgi:DNA-binding transcriptional regulator GbsR (MarR family)